jgi:hypothetical protein
MRFSHLYLGLAFGGLSLGATLIGCGDGGGSGGGNGGGSSTSTSTSTSSGNTGFPCSPKASCTAVDKECLGLVDNASGKAGLRMAHLDLTKPEALTKGVVKNVVLGAVVPNIPSCNVQGTATFNWLIQFDPATNKIKSGGAKPVADPTKGYDFVDETINGLAVKPFEADLTVGADGAFSMATGVDLVVPIFLDTMGTNAVLLPLHAARLINGTLSKSKNCIGKYNAEGLSPANNCLGDATTPTFITDAELDGYITLLEADNVIIDSLGQSLCVLLSGDAATYGTGGSPNKCKMTGGVIDFKGDWCAATNMAAGGGCSDAVTLGAKFAASSVKINN